MAATDITEAQRAAAVKPVAILYVAGIPRTGSTILGELLDRVPGVVYVGELGLFWRRYSRRERCSCGMAIPDCDFWSRVVREAYGDLEPGRAAELAALEQRVLGRGALQVLCSMHPQRASATARALVPERDRLYRAVSSVAASDWIVDATKEPVYACLTTAVVAVVHLVRDPRGVTYSWKKQVGSDSEPGDLPRQSAAATALRWVAKNLIVHTALRRFASRYVLLRYEDLVAAPEESLRRVADATGLPVPDVRSAVEKLGREPENHHRVSGNPGVRQRGNVVHLSLDEEWRSGLSRRDQRVVTGLCAALMAFYRYPLQLLRRPPDD